MTPASHTRPSDGIGGVPLTRDSLDTLRALAVRFRELARPLPEHVIVEIALRRLYSEYCLYDKDIQPTDTTSTRLIKRNSLQVLAARYREYMNLETVILRKRRTA